MKNKARLLSKICLLAGVLSIFSIILGITLSILIPDIGFVNVFRSVGIPLSTVGIITGFWGKQEDKKNVFKKRFKTGLILNSISFILILLTILAVFLFFSFTLFFKP